MVLICISNDWCKQFYLLLLKILISEKLTILFTIILKKKILSPLLCDLMLKNSSHVHDQ